MAVRLQLQGMTEFRAALRQLPEDLADEAGVIVQAQAENVAGQIESGYPQGPTGNLKRGVTVASSSASRFGAGAIVRSRAPHASIFEKGTTQRRTGKGWNRGAMPQPDVSQRMIPKVIRARQRMMAALIDLVRRAGFQVEA
jgi:hypothetical protein